MSNSYSFVLQNKHTKITNFYFLENKIKPRSSTYMRSSILSQIYEKEKDSSTVIIFDWDDTLFTTSFLRSKEKRILFWSDWEKFHDYSLLNITPTKLANLKRLDKIVSTLLKISITYGDVFVITNANEGWVEFSSQMFLPKSHQVLKHITVISSRKKYSQYFPYNPQQWKIETFLNLKDVIEPALVSNIIAIGDSEIEISAAETLAKTYPVALLKTIKLVAKPKIDQLWNELTLVTNKLNKVVMSPKSWAIKLEKS